MTAMRHARATVTVFCVAGCLAATACVDAPGLESSESEDAPLAETFDAMARVSAENGDLARSEGFAYAALSVRGGATPSRVEVQKGTTTEDYDAFVSAVQWDASLPAAMRPPARRSLVAWRRMSDGTIRVFSMHTPSDSAPIINPLSLGMGMSTTAVYAGASAMQNEGRDTPQGKPDMSAAWYATSGWVRLKEVAVLGDCPAAQVAGKGLGIARCEQARYLVRFDLVMQHLAGHPPQVVVGNAMRPMSTIGEPVVSGLKLRFSCLAPSSMYGCQ